MRPRKRAQQRVRPDFAPQLSGARSDIAAEDRRYKRERHSIRGAGRAVRMDLERAADKARDTGLEGRYLRQFMRELEGRNRDVGSGIKGQLAGAKIEHADISAGLAESLDALRLQRGKAVRAESQQIRANRSARREERQEEQAKERKQSGEFERNVRKALAEVRVQVDTVARQVGPGGTAAALSKVLGPEFAMKAAHERVRQGLFEDPGKRRRLVDQLVASQGINRKVAETALTAYLARKHAATVR